MLNDDISFEEAMDIVSNKLANLGTNIKDSKAYDCQEVGFIKHSR